MNTKILRQDKRKKRIRAKISGTKEKPRLVVFRSNKFVYAQIIDDGVGKTLASASSLGNDKKLTKTEQALTVGENLAAAAKKKKISEVVFDRNRYRYHGIIKAVADGARKGGLEF